MLTLLIVVLSRLILMPSSYALSVAALSLLAANALEKFLESKQQTKTNELDAELQSLKSRLSKLELSQNFMKKNG